jgi:hypothetical protein
MHPALLSSVAGAVPNLACRSLSTTVLMSDTHRLLIIHSPQLFIINEFLSSLVIQLGSY